ncbi:MAG: NAD(P)-dependent oxidoreductase [Actinobacteria bacterium]|nr:MAG: NAD(P)-dependent oxidoreductase [Actinomycetota bacterium]
MTAATKHRIGFIGLGNMGAGMASCLVEAGYDLTVYNRTRAKSEEVAKLGARVADSPGDASADADVVMTSLADHTVVSRMLFEDDGVFGRLREGGYVVDLSTVPPGFAREVSRRAQDAGYKAIDACVYGAPWQARSGELRVMVGAASEDDFRAVEDVLAEIGKDVSYLGESGMGAMMKLVINMLMGVQMPSLAEAVVLGERAGLPRERILQMIAGSGYASPVMSFRCDIMGRRAFDQAAFKLALMRKDMMLVLEEAQRLDVPMPVSESAYSMLTAAKRQGLGDLDVGAILAFQERLAGLEGYAWPIDEEGNPVPGAPRKEGAGPPPGAAQGGGRPGAGGPPGAGRPPGVGGPPGPGGPPASARPPEAEPGPKP